MERFVVRVWLPDRPGALGAVASRVGAVRAEIVGIDILERGAGRAIDELVVELPAADLVSLLVAEIDQVDGVDVEDVRPAPAHLVDPRLDALETAAALVAAPSVDELLGVLTGRVRLDFEADWSAVVDVEAGGMAACDGPVPEVAWLTAFIAGSRSSAAAVVGDHGPDDVAWAELGMSHGLVLGRRGRPFRARERQQLAALARIATSRSDGFGLGRRRSGSQAVVEA